MRGWWGDIYQVGRSLSCRFGACRCRSFPIAQKQLHSIHGSTRCNVSVPFCSCLGQWLFNRCGVYEGCIDGSCMRKSGFALQKDRVSWGPLMSYRINWPAGSGLRPSCSQQMRNPPNNRQGRFSPTLRPQRGKELTTSLTPRRARKAGNWCVAKVVPSGPLQKGWTGRFRALAR